MPTGYNPRQQGDLGEASAMAWLSGAIGKVLVPLFHSPDYDFVVDTGEQFVRVQVKTSTRYTQYGRFQVQLSTRGGNQSWNGVARLFDSSRCDYLFVLVADGRRWFIPATAVEATTGICLGGSKYSEFEVERGTPLPARTPRPPETRR
jgi:hypothetical protein